MSGVIMQAVDWKESADELHELYKKQRDLETRKRLVALWSVRRGESVTDAARIAGVGRRTLTRWLAWYREASRRCFRGCPGTAPWAASAG
jgi:transposase-like protein